MSKEIWKKKKQVAVENFVRENLEKIKKYNPDVVLGKQPYAGALSSVLSMGDKTVDVSTIPSPDVDLDYFQGRKVLAVNDDIWDSEIPKRLIERFDRYINNIGGFMYAVGDPITMFTFDELKNEYGGSNGDE